MVLGVVVMQHPDRSPGWGSGCRALREETASICLQVKHLKRMVGEGLNLRKGERAPANAEM